MRDFSAGGNDHCSNDSAVVHRRSRELGVLPFHRLGALPPPRAGEGWGGGELARVLLHAPSLSLPRRRGRGRCGASDGFIIINRVGGYSTTVMRMGTVRQNRWALLQVVIAGLDPAIHQSSQRLFCKEDGCAGQARA